MDEVIDPSKIFDLFGQSGVLLYACYFFLRQLKAQYEARMTQYEARIKNLEEANRQLTEKHDTIVKQLLYERSINVMPPQTEQQAQVPTARRRPRYNE